MAVLLIAYDLNREVVRPPLLKLIKEQFPTWCYISESCYLVVTERSTVNVRS
jgi:hypothetical protein